MSLRNQPYFPLYVQDYLTDEKLNECSASSQGIYIKILCVLHKQKEYGKLLLKQNEQQNKNFADAFAEKLLRHLPFTINELKIALEELISEDVLQIDTEIGVLSQKRMIRDNELSIKRSLAGSKGGFATAKRVAKKVANTEYENENENEDVNEDINKLWIRCFKRNPSIVEYEKTSELITKHSFEIIEKAFRKASLGNVSSLATVEKRLDDKGYYLDYEEYKKTKESEKIREF